METLLNITQTARVLTWRVGMATRAVLLTPACSCWLKVRLEADDTRGAVRPSAPPAPAREPRSLFETGRGGEMVGAEGSVLYWGRCMLFWRIYWSVCFIFYSYFLLFIYFFGHLDFFMVNGSFFSELQKGFPRLCAPLLFLLRGGLGCCLVTTSTSGQLCLTSVHVLLSQCCFITSRLMIRDIVHRLIFLFRADFEHWADVFIYLPTYLFMYLLIYLLWDFKASNRLSGFETREYSIHVSVVSRGQEHVCFVRGNLQQQ